jgi:hypothetical protein
MNDAAQSEGPGELGPSPLIKVCSKCKEPKRLTAEFWFRNKSRPSGFTDFYCKACWVWWVREYRKKSPERHRRWQKISDLRRHGHEKWRGIWQKYRLTREQYEAMLVAQGGTCANPLCGDSLAKPHVDHDHATGKVRGVLCQGCNIALGAIRENEDRLRGLSLYIRKVR